MQLTTVRIERPQGTVVARGIAVQIDQSSTLEHMDLEHARSFDIFEVFTTQGVPLVPIRRRDVLVDEVNVDPETGLLAQYRVSGLVETFAGDHQECVVERVVGG